MFRPDTTKSWHFSLFWSASASDYDMYLGDSSLLQVTQGIEESNVPPETMSASLSAGATYYIIITGWSGNAGDYYLEIN